MFIVNEIIPTFDTLNVCLDAIRMISISKQSQLLIANLEKLQKEKKIILNPSFITLIRYLSKKEFFKIRDLIKRENNKRWKSFFIFILGRVMQIDNYKPTKEDFDVAGIKNFSRKYVLCAAFYLKAMELGETRSLNKLGVLINKNLYKPTQKDLKIAKITNVKPSDNNHKLAAAFYLKASELGETRSLNNLGLLIDENLYKPIQKDLKIAKITNVNLSDNNHKLAAAFYLKASELGETRSLHNLGLLIGKNLYTPTQKDLKIAKITNVKPSDNKYKLAASFYLKASELGETRSLYNLGLLISENLYTPTQKDLNVFGKAPAFQNAWNNWNRSDKLCLFYLHGTFCFSALFANFKDIYGIICPGNLDDNIELLLACWQMLINNPNNAMVKNIVSCSLLGKHIQQYAKKFPGFIKEKAEIIFFSPYLKEIITSKELFAEYINGLPLSILKNPKNHKLIFQELLPYKPVLQTKTSYVKNFIDKYCSKLLKAELALFGFFGQPQDKKQGKKMLKQITKDEGQDYIEAQIELYSIYITKKFPKFDKARDCLKKILATSKSDDDIKWAKESLEDICPDNDSIYIDGVSFPMETQCNFNLLINGCLSLLVELRDFFHPNDSQWNELLKKLKNLPYIEPCNKNSFFSQSNADRIFTGRIVAIIYSLLKLKYKEINASSKNHELNNLKISKNYEKQKTLLSELIKHKQLINNQKNNKLESALQEIINNVCEAFGHNKKDAIITENVKFRKSV